MSVCGIVFVLYHHPSSKVPRPVAPTDHPYVSYGFLRWLRGKESAYQAGNAGYVPGLRRSSGEGNGNPLQYSCLENPMDGGAWQATVHGVANSRTRLSDWAYT